MTYQVENAERMLWFHGVWTCGWSATNFVRSFEVNHQRECSVTSHANYLIRLSAFAREKPRQRPPVTEAQFNEFQAAFIRSPRKSTTNAARYLIISHAILYKILRKHVKFKVKGTDCCNR